MKLLTTILILIALPLAVCAQPKDLHTTLEPILGFAPVIESSNTAYTTPVIDTSLYGGVEFYFLTGTLADGGAAFTVTVNGGDVIDATGTTITDTAAITAAGNFIGTLLAASFSEADDSTVTHFGYVGAKRYIKVTLTPSGNGAAAPLACLVIGRPLLKPAN